MVKYLIIVPLIVGAILLLPACASLRIENVNFGWPVENVLTVGPDNALEEGRYAISFNVANLATEEFQDSTALKGSTIRILRSAEGYYFVTGSKFKNVYVFAPAPHELRLRSKLEVSPAGLRDPALNQRPPYVELVDGDAFKRLLANDEIVEGTK